MTDFDGFCEGVNDLVCLEVVVDEYLTAKIALLGGG